MVLGLEAADDDGLCVRGTNESPAFLKNDSGTVYFDGLVSGSKVRAKRIDNFEFFFIRAFNPKLRS